MQHPVSGRRGFLAGVLGAALAGRGVPEVAADQKHGAAPSGVAATWQYRWSERLRSPNPAARPQGLPEDFVPIGDHQKYKTQHWVKPKDWPVGPTIQSREGEVVSVEFRIAKRDFERGFSWGLVYPEALRHLPVDHVDIDMVGAGHFGFEIPHYEVHAYFVPHSAHGACEI